MRYSRNMTPQEVAAEVDRLVAQYGKMELRSYEIPGLPPEKRPTPDLVKHPAETEFTERIGNTDYTVKAHFRTEGWDLLCLLNQLLGYGVAAREENDANTQD